MYGNRYTMKAVRMQLVQSISDLIDGKVSLAQSKAVTAEQVGAVESLKLDVAYKLEAYEDFVLAKMFQEREGF